MHFQVLGTWHPPPAALRTPQTPLKPTQEPPSQASTTGPARPAFLQDHTRGQQASRAKHPTAHSLLLTTKPDHPDPRMENRQGCRVPGMEGRGERPKAWVGAA